jgi:hypothetical protein
MTRHISGFFLGLILGIALSASAATISFTVPDPIIPELVGEMQDRYGRLPSETNTQLAQRITREYFWRVLVEDRRKRIAAGAQTATAAELGTN